MKKTVLILSIVASVGTLSFAQNNWPIAPASPTQYVTQLFGTSKIDLSYSRPGIKGRVIFGNVVPFDKIWRTGANGPTTLKFGEEVIVNGTKLPAGKYGLLTIPGKTEWQIVLTKDTNINSPTLYKPENDVVRIKTKPTTLSSPIENFTIDINNIKPNEADIFLRWEKTEVSFKISVDLDTKATKYITDIMNADTKPYFQAASFYYDNGKDLNQALEWINKAIATNPAFYVLFVKAKIQFKLKDKAGALVTSQQSLEKAKAANNDDYIKNNERLIAEINASK